MSSIIDQIFEAGIVGCGGAGFPTHVKLGGGGIRHLILNGAECEPLLRTDRYIMKHKATELVQATQMVFTAIGAERCTIALKAGYIQEIAALEAAIAQTGSGVTLCKMKGFYPAGDEQAMVQQVTGSIVPPAGIPLDVGAAVSNVATILAAGEAAQGKPLTHKYLTVTGEVANPTVAYVPVGTSFADCIGLAGGAAIEDYIVISGGPMMGLPLTKEQAAETVVTKTTSGILVLPNSGYLAAQSKIPLSHMFNRARSACIQCRYCTDLCPRYLLGHPLEPHMIMRKTAMGGDIRQLLDDPDIRSAALCCECGVCEIVACPMELQPRRVNVTIKQALAEAGIRYPKGEQPEAPRTGWQYRKIPAKRAAVRANVLKYYDYQIDSLIEYTPGALRIPLQQHIGAAAQPVVGVGDRVSPGQLIARCPEGKLGANIHTGIGGRVAAVGQEILIESEGPL